MPEEKHRVVDGSATHLLTGDKDLVVLHPFGNVQNPNNSNSLNHAYAAILKSCSSRRAFVASASPGKGPMHRRPATKNGRN